MKMCLNLQWMVSSVMAIFMAIFNLQLAETK